MGMPRYEPRQKPLYMPEYQDATKGDLKWPLTVIVVIGGLAFLLAWIAWSLLRSLL